MSIDALCLAVKSHLQSQLGLDDNHCDLVLEGQPTPVAGQEFIGIHDGGWDGQSMDYDLDELYRVQVTITRRIGDVPLDRIGSQVVWKAGQDMSERIRQIISMPTGLHKNYDILNAANALINAQSGGPWNGFVVPLYFLGASGPQFRGPEWFYAAIKERNDAIYGQCGVSRTLTFGKAQRVQTASFTS